MDSRTRIDDSLFYCHILSFLALNPTETNRLSDSVSNALYESEINLVNWYILSSNNIDSFEMGYMSIVLNAK